MGMPTTGAIPDAAINPDLMEAQTGLKDINEGLNSFLLHPPGMKGEKKFQHLIFKRKTCSTQDEPSAHLMIDVDKSAKAVISTTSQLRLTQRDIMKDVGKAARIQLCNQLDDINLHSGRVNDEEHLRKMHSQVLIILLLETIEALKVAEANKKRKPEMSELIVNALAAKAKLAAK